METLWQDVRYAARGLLKSPGFTALAAITLALGIGANTAIFSVLHGVVLKPLPYERPDEILRVWPQRKFSKHMLATFEQASSFTNVTGYHGAALTLTGGGDPEELTATAVASTHFAVLGVQPGHGRAFRAEDREPGAEPVVMLSHGLWQRRFGSDRGILGRVISLAGLGADRRTVVGVLPADFKPLSGDSELWVPVVFDPANPDDYRDTIGFRALARLAPGVTLAQAEAEVRTLARRLQQESPEYYDQERVRTAGVAPLHDILVGGVRPTLWVLLGAVGFVLLIGCSNIANMLLARAGGRQREMAVRAAMGAGRARLIRQLLTESALLGALGGAAGLVAAAWLETLLVSSLPASVPRSSEIGIHFEELGFAAGLSLLAALIFGLVPALRSIRTDLQGDLRDGARRTAGRASLRLNQGLVIAEVALSVVLVAGAGLMLKSLWLLQQVEPGFEPRQLLTLRLSPGGGCYADAEPLDSYYRRVLEQVRAVPGAVSASAINYLPMTSPDLRMGYSTEDHPVTPQTRVRSVSYRTVTPGYLRTMGIPLVAGRALTAADRGGAPQVGLINQAMARQLWPDQDAVGKQILWDDASPWFRVVGVVGDIRQHRLDLETKPQVYRPFGQAFDELMSPAMYLTVRTAGDAAALAPAVRQAVWSLDADVPIARLRSMDRVITLSLAGSRFFTTVLVTFGALALILGAVGVYGVGSYTVSRRTRELGIRMALGARRQTLLRSVMKRELVPVALGVALGVAGALAATRVLASSLFGVTATDPSTFLGVALVLGAVAMVSSYLPARRASRVDPIVALRSE